MKLKRLYSNVFGIKTSKCKGSALRAHNCKTRNRSYIDISLWLSKKSKNQDQKMRYMAISVKLVDT